MLKRFLVALLAFSLWSAAFPDVRYQPASTLRQATNCDTTACSGAGQVCVEPVAGTLSELHLCNPTTGFFGPAVASTKAQLPASVAYEDEANKFTIGQEVELNAANPIGFTLDNLGVAQPSPRFIFSPGDANTDIELQTTADGKLEVKDRNTNPWFRFHPNAGLGTRNLEILDGGIILSAGATVGTIPGIGTIFMKATSPNVVSLIWDQDALNGQTGIWDQTVDFGDKRSMTFHHSWPADPTKGIDWLFVTHEAYPQIGLGAMGTPIAGMDFLGFSGAPNTRRPFLFRPSNAPLSTTPGFTITDRSGLSAALSDAFNVWPDGAFGTTIGSSDATTRVFNDNSGNRTISLGTAGTIGSNIHQAMTRNNVAVKHSELRFNLDGTVGFYADYVHRADGVDLTSTLLQRLGIDTSGNVTINGGATINMALRMPITDTALTAQGRMRVGNLTPGLFWYDTAERGLRSTGDAAATMEPVSGAGGSWGLPRLTALPVDTTPGACAYILPSDGTHACEGKIACALAVGVRCFDGVAP